MKLPKIVTVFKIKINYKSGISEIFECRSFDVENGQVKWTNAGEKRPVLMNYFEAVESVWRVSQHKTIVWE